MTHTPRYLTVRTVAAQLGISVQAVHDRIAKGKLTTIRRGKGKTAPRYVMLKSLAKWKLERAARARKLLASPDLRNGQ